MCEGLSKISRNFTLYLIKVGKLKRFKKVSSDLKTILKTDLANLRFLSFEKGEACQSILIMLRGKIGLSKPEVKKIGCVWSFLLLEEFKMYLTDVLKYFLAYLGSSVKTTIVDHESWYIKMDIQDFFFAALVYEVLLGIFLQR